MATDPSEAVRSIRESMRYDRLLHYSFLLRESSAIKVDLGEYELRTIGNKWTYSYSELTQGILTFDTHTLEVKRNSVKNGFPVFEVESRNSAGAVLQTAY